MYELSTKKTMKNNLYLNSIKQGSWTDKELPLLRKKLEIYFQLPAANTSQTPIKITNHTLQRLALMAGLSIQEARNKEAIHAIKLKSAIYFDKLFHADEFYPLLTATLKVHYQQVDMDWENAAEVSKLINFEMERGAKFLLDKGHLLEGKR